MVKEARFSFPFRGGPPADLTGADSLADLDELVGDDHTPSTAARRRRQSPVEKQPDPRHLAGADWEADAGFVDEE